MFIKRDMEKTISAYLERDEEHCNTLLLAGARQVGKTTLIEELLRNDKAIIINFYESAKLPRMIDETQSFEEFERLLFRELNFKPSTKIVLVIDEAQESKQLGRWIHFFKKKWTNQKVIISGSILSNLFEEDVAYPVGRVEEIVLRPFTFKEYLTAVKREGLREIIEKVTFENPINNADREALIKPYLDYLQIGGMPEIVINASQNKETAFQGWDRLLRQYAMDVERHMDEIYKTMFISSLERIADITCYPIKNSQIISTSSPSYRKLPLLLEVAEKWHLQHKISAQTRHPESASGLASKRYLFDVGLTNFFLTQSQTVEWVDRSESGNLIYPKLQENFVCNELIAANPHPQSNLNYYKDTRNSQEVDFIFTIGNRIVPIEVKSQSSISRNGLIPMVNFLDSKGLDVGILVYNGQMQTMEYKGKIIHVIQPFLVSELKKLLE